MTSHLLNHKPQSKIRRQQLGEVFTPIALVNEILDKVPQELFTDPDKTILDPSCGNGNFLVEALKRKLQHTTTRKALQAIYGVEIMQDNVAKCKLRLLDLAAEADEVSRETAFTRYIDILDNNIVCADALKYHYRFDGSPPYDKISKE